MSVDQNYRRYASECIRLAQGVSNEHDRAILDRMACAWIHLADAQGVFVNEPAQRTSLPLTSGRGQQ